MDNQPPEQPSPQGRRVLVALVTGTAGECIQRWRQTHDPYQARRLPPHVTLCYWAPDGCIESLERQVRHAFAERVTVRLGGVRQFDNGEHTFYVEVLDTARLDAARRRLYDGTYAPLPPLCEWTWHVTCVRNANGRDLTALRRAAAGLRLDTEWTVDTVGYLELRGDTYEPIAQWRV
jgi:2'-5' RNA ligase